MFGRSGGWAWLVRTLRSELPDIPFIAASGMAGIGSANQIHSRKVSDNFIYVAMKLVMWQKWVR